MTLIRRLIPDLRPGLPSVGDPSAVGISTSMRCGPPGEDGADGEPGPPGRDGASGVVTAVSLTNNEAGAIVCGAPVYSNAAGGIKKALATTATSGTALCIGLMLDTSVAAGAQGSVAIDGLVTLTTAQWDAVTGQSGGLTFGANYFVDPTTAGKLTTTPPSTVTQYVTMVGSPVSATTMILRLGIRVKL